MSIDIPVGLRVRRESARVSTVDSWAFADFWPSSVQEAEDMRRVALCLTEPAAGCWRGQGCLFGEQVGHWIGTKGSCGRLKGELVSVARSELQARDNWQMSRSASSKVNEKYGKKDEVIKR